MTVCGSQGWETYRGETQLATKLSNSIIGTVLTNRNFWVALLIMVTANVGNACVRQPVTLLGDDLGLTASAIGFITSIYTVFAMLGRGPFGNAVDHAKKKTWVLAAQYIARGIIFIGFALCATIPMYVVLKFMQGLTFGMGHIAMMIVIAETMDKKALGTAFGLITLLPKLLSAVTTSITLWITTTFGVEYSCYAGAVLSFVPAALCLLLKMPERDEAEAAKPKKKFSLNTFAYWRAIPLVLIMTFVSVPSLFIDNFMVLFGREAGIDGQAAGYLTNYMMWMGIGAFLAGYAFDRWGFKKNAVVLCICAAVAQIMIGITLDSTVWIVSAVLCGIAAGGIAVIIRSFAVLKCPPTITALVVATLGVMQDLASLVGSAAGGVLADVLGYTTTFQVIAAFPVIALVMVVFFLPGLVKVMQGGKAAQELPAEAKAEPGAKSE